MEPCGDGCVRTGLSLFEVQVASSGFDPEIDDLLSWRTYLAPWAVRLGSELRSKLYPSF